MRLMLSTSGFLNGAAGGPPAPAAPGLAEGAAPAPGAACALVEAAVPEPLPATAPAGLVVAVVMVLTFTTGAPSFCFSFCGSWDGEVVCVSGGDVSKDPGEERKGKQQGEEKRE